MKQHTRLLKCPYEDCKYATKGFGQPRDLENHLKTHQPGSEASYRCFVCESGGTRVDNMKRHLKMMHGIEMHQTDVARECKRK